MKYLWNISKSKSNTSVQSSEVGQKRNGDDNYRWNKKNHDFIFFIWIQIKSPSHTSEKFCIQDHSSRILKDIDF